MNLTQHIATAKKARAVGRRVKAARKATETEFHITVGQFLDIALPQDADWWHCPNGGQRNPIEAARMTRLGVRRGQPDIEILWRGRAYFIELKREGERPEDHQRNRMIRLEACGAVCGWSTSLEGVESQLRRFGIPIRARAA